MRIVIFIGLVALLAGTTSCAPQKTCPVYSKAPAVEQKAQV